MATVIGIDNKHVHTVSCHNCASIVQYTKSEVKRVDGKDYSGGPDGNEHIHCPNCNHQIILRSW